MGHKYQLDTAKIVAQINAAVYEQTSGYNEGFLSWGYKQDLYRIKWILDDALRRCPEYGPEKEWLREQEKEQVIRILSNDN
jgi:hypothetical protein